MIRLQDEDRQQLIQLLANVPELETERGRRQLLEYSNLGQFAARIDLSGNTLIAIRAIVSNLSRYGRLDDGQAAIGRLLNTVKDLVGIEQQAVIDRLIAKYQMTAPDTSSPNTSEEQSVGQQKILILTAIPHGLRLDREIREVEEAIQRSTRRELFEIRTRTAVRPQDIRRAIGEERPHIVHFCGHGLKDGSLVLEDDGGNNKPIAPEALAALFKLYADCVNCVLLNACHSSKSAEAASQYINYAIGMNQPIGDSAAIAFARGFYDALGYQTSDSQSEFERAFEEGQVAVMMENLSEGYTPVFKKKP